ncbi:MAG: hypothetical protein ACRDSZ_22575 [Pseudonocardiaceae bacterium]
MASIGPVRLRITVDSAIATTSRARVLYTITFNQQDIAGNIRYRELITLFGEDPPAGPAGDDLLFTFVPPRIVRPDGRVTVQRSISANVPNSVLDEDPGGLEDEIYARVRLTALDPPFPLVEPRVSSVVSI